MTVRIGSRALLAGVVLALCGLAGGARPAAAQLAPPEEAEVVLQVVSPVVSPTCANAGLAIVVLPTFLSASPVPIPSQLIQSFGPVVTVCGLFPAPGQRIACPLDDTLGEIATQLGVAVVGQPLPLDVRVMGPVIEVLNEISGLISGDPEPIASGAVTSIGCREVDLAPDAPDGGPAIDVPSAPTVQPLLPSEDLVLHVDLAPRPVVSSPAAVPGLPTGPVTATPVVAVHGFDYPVAFAIPLALLALAAFLSWTFASPVEARTEER